MPDINPTPPAPPTTPTPAPEAAPVTTPSPSPTTKSWTDALDALPDIDTPAPANQAEPKPAPQDSKHDAKQDAVIPAKPDAKPEANPDAKPDAKPDQDGLPAFRTNQELRKWAKERNAAAVENEKKRVELENKLKELETRVPKTEQGAELLAQQLADAQKKLQEHEQLIEIQAFEHSQKYQQEYAAPYYAARQKAYKDVAEMIINERTGEFDEDGKPQFRQRPATPADFDKIYSMPRPQARAAAKEMFGDDAADIMSHRSKISDLAEKAQAALAERRRNYSKYKQEEESTESQKQIAIQGLWRTANEKISQDPKKAMYWGEDKDDPDANKALASGFKLADEFFSEKRDQMSPQDRVEFDAHIRHTIAMGPRLAYKLNKMAALLKAKDDEIAQLRGSAPGAPKPVSDEQPSAKPASTAEAIDAM